MNKTALAAAAAALLLTACGSTDPSSGEPPVTTSAVTVADSEAQAETKPTTTTTKTATEAEAETTTKKAGTKKTTTTTAQQTTTTTTTAETTTTQQTTTAPVQPVTDEARKVGNVYVVGSGENVRAMPVFYELIEVSQRYSNIVNKYKSTFGDALNVYNMDIPLSTAFYMPEKTMKQLGLSDQHECIKNVGKYLKDVTNIDVYDALDAHKDEYIYSRTDHHWQPLGAYYAAQVFAEQAGVPFPDLSTYTKKVKQDFLGSMYTYSGQYQELADNPDTFTYFEPDNKYPTTYYSTSFTNGEKSSLFFDYMSGAACYLTFLASDDRITEIDTDCDNGRVLVIMKDSYGNAIVPFLTHSFSKIYVLDFRYLNIGAATFMKKVGATDLLFAVSISGGHTPSHLDTIEADLY